MKLVQFFFFSLLLFLASCTIQKRTFRSGYSIEWRGKFKPESRNELVLNENEISNEKLPDIETSSNEDNLELKSKMKADEFQTPEKIIVEEKKVNRLREEFEEAIDRNMKHKNKKRVMDEIPYTEKEYGPESGMVSLIFSLFSIFGWILFFSTSTSLSVALVICFGLAGIIFGIVALRKHKKYPNKYAHKWPAKLGFWLSFISTFLFLSLIVLVIAALSSWGG